MGNISDAKKAMQAVHAKWGARLPVEFAKTSANDIFVFCDSMKYSNYFEMIYVITFARALKLTDPAQKFVCGVPAFCSPHPRSRRQIYVSPKKDATEKVLAHEYIHYLTDETLYPELYKTGGKNPGRIEGITQWLTVACGYKQNEHPVGYDKEYLAVDSWLSKSTGRLDAMLGYIFDGVATDLSKLLVGP